MPYSFYYRNKKSCKIKASSNRYLKCISYKRTYNSLFIRASLIRNLEEYNRIRYEEESVKEDLL